jgi:hypothetical protein
MSNGNPIIIKGGESITVLLSKDTFPQDSVDSEKHHCEDRRIVRVMITDDNTQQSNSCEIPENGKCTISIEHIVE